ncbi:unnamed protein product [Toxocara canis]|uniref:BRCT domain-containing protein n=1 Tax=Toxocara canis TaxID=6265 RepID=A0A3P7HEQ4_TOXCA|nr:unnamed protein product [Toxocara canis]
MLEGKRVLFGVHPEKLHIPTHLWSPLIQHMGATLFITIPIDGIDILLADASCPEEVLASARSFNAIIVSFEWIVQSVICGYLLDPNAHERFSYNAVARD